MYISLFLLLRVILKRQAGTLSVSDLLLVVLIADAAQNGMAGDYKSITDGILLVAVLVFWNYFLDWLGYKLPDSFGRLIHPPPLPLIKNGKIIYPNLRREMITLEELRSQLREQGIEDVEEVRSAQMEGDGHISAIRHDRETHAAPRARAT